MRGWQAFALITGYLCVIGGLGWLIYAADVSSFGNVINLGSTGAEVFRLLAGAVMATVALIVPGLVGPTISGERERQTLDLLLVTPLAPARIVVGKLLAALLFVAVLVVACLPLFSVAFLLGGVPLSEVLEAVAFILVGALTLGALSMLVSVLLPRVATSTVVAYLVMLALAVGPVAGGYALSRAFSQPLQPGPSPSQSTRRPVPPGWSTRSARRRAPPRCSTPPTAGSSLLSLDSGIAVPISVGCGRRAVRHRPRRAGDLAAMGSEPVARWGRCRRRARSQHFGPQSKEDSVRPGHDVQPPAQELAGALAPFYRRARADSAVRWGLAAVGGWAIAVCLLLAWSKLYPTGDVGLVAVVIGACALVIASAAWAWRRPSLVQVARLADARLDLDERLASARSALPELRGI